MSNYIVVDGEGNIINRVVWDGVSEWSAPVDCTCEEDTNNEWEIGGTFIEGVYTAPASLPEEN